MTSTLSGKEIRAFQEEILSWYEQHQRDLPWRHTRDPYKILVSEIMSQQTQIMRVVPKYGAWTSELPTVESLAKAPVSTVLQLWSGLGYNRRALFLQKTAQAVVEKYHGVFPKNVEALQKLPGIGKYTASAVACFAYDMQIPVIDTNIRKVIAVHFFDGVLPEEKVIEETAWELLPKGKAALWNQALMDYAGAELKAHKIPIPKQSKLLGSDRYYRGQTLKFLILNQEASSMKHVNKETLLNHFKNIGHPCNRSRYERILKGMEKEGFILIKNEILLLPN